MNIDRNYWLFGNSPDSREWKDEWDINNINNKDKNKLLNDEFITLLRDKKNFNSDKFTFQIENIRKFIENKKAYDKGLISKIKKEFNIENNNELLDFFLDKNLFKIKDIISMKFNLNSSFSYNYKSNKINDDNPIDAFTIDDEKIGRAHV